MSLHYSNAATSPRLRRALAALREYPAGLTTRQWLRKAHICAVNSVAAELRAQGYPVLCTPEGKLYRYRLVTP
jgi:hypothetical protein